MSYIVASLPPLKCFVRREFLYNHTFQAAKEFWTVDGTRKWSAGDDWFYDIKEKSI
jgi:hypothetical protein